MSSLRNVIFKQKNLNAHFKAVKIYKQSENKNKQIEKSFENPHKSKMLTTERLFRTMYKINKL